MVIPLNVAESDVSNMFHCTCIAIIPGDEDGVFFSPWNVCFKFLSNLLDFRNTEN